MKKRFFTTMLVLTTSMALFALGTKDNADKNIWDHISPIEGQMEENGDGSVTFTFTPQNVRAIDAGFGYEVEIIQGEETKIEVTVDGDNKDSTLVGFNKERPGQLIITRKTNALDAVYRERVTITIPVLDELDLSMNACWIGGSLNQDIPFFLDISKGSRCKVEAQISVPHFTITQESPYPAKITGETEIAVVEISRGMSLDLSGFAINELKLDVSADAVFTGEVTAESYIDGSRGSIINLTQNEGIVKADLSSGSVLNMNGDARVLKIDE